MSRTDTAENRSLDWMTGNTTTAPVTPLKIRLMTANGSDSTAGTEVTGGTYVAQSATFGAASGGVTSNTAIVRFDGMPACDVTGFEVWDSAGTPVRWRWAVFGSSISFAALDSAEFAAGQLTLTET